MMHVLKLPIDQRHQLTSTPWHMVLSFFWTRSWALTLSSDRERLGVRMGAWGTLGFLPLFGGRGSRGSPPQSSFKVDMLFPVTNQKSGKTFQKDLGTERQAEEIKKNVEKLVQNTSRQTVWENDQTGKLCHPHLLPSHPSHWSFNPPPLPSKPLVIQPLPPSVLHQSQTQASWFFC